MNGALEGISGMDAECPSSFCAACPRAKFNPDRRVIYARNERPVDHISPRDNHDSFCVTYIDISLTSVHHNT